MEVIIMKNKKLRVFTGIFAAASIFAMTGIMGVSAEEKTDISEKEAMEIAIADAEVDQDEIERLRVQLDYDDGMLIYDVEFYIGNKEYDYEINAYTGDILERDFDIEEEIERS